MTTATIGQRARHPRREAPTHLFAIGQNVRRKVGFGGTALPGDIYQITGTLPPLGNSPQYRIRCDEIRHERVITEDDLEAVAVAPAEDALIERTFGTGNRS